MLPDFLKSMITDFDVTTCVDHVRISMLQRTPLICCANAPYPIIVPRVWLFSLIDLHNPNIWNSGTDIILRWYILFCYSHLRLAKLYCYRLQGNSSQISGDWCIGRTTTVPTCEWFWYRESKFIHSLASRFLLKLLILTFYLFQRPRVKSLI